MAADHGLNFVRSARARTVYAAILVHCARGKPRLERITRQSSTLSKSTRFPKSSQTPWYFEQLFAEDVYIERQTKLRFYSSP